MAPPYVPKNPITRQLAPTVGPKALGVTFKAGALGKIGRSMAVGRANLDGDVGFVEADSWTPAHDELVSSFIIPIGDINIFTGFTAAAYGFPGDLENSSPPTTQKTDRIRHRLRALRLTI